MKKYRHYRGTRNGRMYIPRSGTPVPNVNLDDNANADADGSKLLVVTNKVNTNDASKDLVVTTEVDDAPKLLVIKNNINITINDNSSSVNNSTDSGGTPCIFCSRKFKNKRGVSVHLRTCKFKREGEIRQAYELGASQNI